MLGNLTAVVMESTVLSLQTVNFLNVQLKFHAQTIQIKLIVQQHQPTAIQQRESASVLKTPISNLLKVTSATTILVLQFMDNLLVTILWDNSAHNIFVTLLKAQLVLNAQITLLHPVRLLSNTIY